MKKLKDHFDPLFLTAEKIQDIKAEIENIEKEILPEIRHRMAIAYEDGDLPENNPWETANIQLQETMKLRNDLRRLLHRSKQFQTAGKTIKSKIGKSFTISINNGEPIKVTLVSSVEASPLTGKISCESPIGKVLETAKKGETVMIETPGGKISVKIIS